MSTTGERLREIRRSLRYTLRDVGDKVGISYSNLAAIERGEQNCNSTTLKILADYYNVSTDYLIGTTDDKNKSNSIDVAFYDQHGILTDSQKKEIESFIEYIKARDNK